MTDRCSDGGEMTVPAVKTLVMVLDAETPTITLSGIRSQAVDEYDLAHGIHLFPDLIVDATTKAEHNERNSDSDDDTVCSTLITLLTCVSQFNGLYHDGHKP